MVTVLLHAVDIPSLPAAVCRGVEDADVFFPVSGRRGYPDTRRAQAMCGRCDDQAPCLIWALTRPESRGIWGGSTESDRRRFHRDQAVSA